MVQCEMCGAETPSPKTVKVEGAELQVCADCAEFGTEVKTESTSSGTSTKYSTSSGGSDTGSESTSAGGSATSSTSSGGSSGRAPGSDMLDDVAELAQDYDERIRSAREGRGLSQQELADELNEKASLIRKLERGETLPSDDIQSKLERALDVSLSAGEAGIDEEWESDADTGEYTLGDVVQRKD